MKKPEVLSAQRVQKTQEKNQKMTREEMQRHILRMRDRDEEVVSGVFQNLENRAGNGSLGAVTFSYKMYPGQDNIIYELMDGQRYTLPRGVARHLNNNCFYREYQHIEGERGQEGLRQGVPDGRLCTRNMQMSRKVHRYAFHNLDYMEDDVDMYPSNLIEVTTSL